MSVAMVEVKPEDSVAPWRGATGQEAHTADELAPEVDEKVPEGHVAVHVWEVRPAVSPQVRAGQGVQVEDVALPHGELYEVVSEEVVDHLQLEGSGESNEEVNEVVSEEVVGHLQAEGLGQPQ